MTHHHSPPPAARGVSRRGFLRAGAATALLGGAGVAPRTGPLLPTAAAAEPTGEWRNRQSGMSYRRLGRTNLMISEVVSGGDPITLANYKHLELALEMGLNYLDMAPAYNGGDTERAYGKLLASSPSLRQKVFLTTKISDFNKQRERMYRELFDRLPES